MAALNGQPELEIPMQICYGLTLTLVAGMVGGLAAIHEASAQSKTPIYVVNEIEVKDQAAFQTYKDAQEALIQKHSGRFIIRGGKITAVDGAAPKRFTMYVFDSMAQLTAWQDEPSQKDLTAARDQSSTFRSFVVEGLPQ